MVTIMDPKFVIRLLRHLAGVALLAVGDLLGFVGIVGHRQGLGRRRVQRGHEQVRGMDEGPWARDTRTSKVWSRTGFGVLRHRDDGDDEVRVVLGDTLHSRTRPGDCAHALYR